MKWIVLILGIGCVLLGGLWLLQGLDLVRMQPILCISECEVLTGPAPGWAVAGLILTLVGILAIIYAAWRRPPPPSD